MTRGHEPQGVVDALAPLASHIFFTQPQERARPAAELPAAATVSLPPYEIVPSVPEAVERAMSMAHADDLVCVTGSFYVVGEVPVERWQNRQYVSPEEGMKDATSGESAEHGVSRAT